MKQLPLQQRWQDKQIYVFIIIIAIARRHHYHHRHHSDHCIVVKRSPLFV